MRWSAPQDHVQRPRPRTGTPTLTPMTVTLGLCSQIELDFNAARRKESQCRRPTVAHPAASLRDHQERLDSSRPKTARRPSVARCSKRNDRRQEGGRGIRGFRISFGDFKRGVNLPVLSEHRRPTDHALVIPGVKHKFDVQLHQIIHTPDRGYGSPMRIALRPAPRGASRNDR